MSCCCALKVNWIHDNEICSGSGPSLRFTVQGVLAKIASRALALERALRVHAGRPSLGFQAIRAWTCCSIGGALSSVSSRIRLTFPDKKTDIVAFWGQGAAPVFEILAIRARVWQAALILVHAARRATGRGRSGLVVTGAAWTQKGARRVGAVVNLRPVPSRAESGCCAHRRPGRGCRDAHPRLAVVDLFYALISVHVRRSRCAKRRHHAWGG